MIKTKVVFLALFSCLFLFFSCGQKRTDSSDKPPDWVNDILPEGEIWGIGAAKAESDGEAILLAEDRARLEIARQLSSEIKRTLTDYDNAAYTDFTEISTHVNFSGSEVKYREKDGNGVWWCLISLSNNNNLSVEPPQDGVLGALMSNAAELSDMDLRKDIIRNAETSNLDWVFRPGQYLQGDMFYGLGAAKLNNDKDSVQLAKDRARRSLARSIYTEVKESIFDIDDSGNMYQEDNFAVESKYDFSVIATKSVYLAKTKDGTWWVLLGYKR